MGDAERQQTGDEIEVRALLPGDAERLTACFERYYGTRYAHEVYVDPAVIRERLAQGRLHSAVAVTSEQTMRRDKFVECARRYISALGRHMDIEDADFFPRAVEALSVVERAAIAARLPELDDPLFGSATRDRYRALSETLLAV